MKFMKYLLVLALALSALASVSNAQTVAFLGSGSSALFLELGQAAVTSSTTGTSCAWTANSASTIVVEDQRTSPSTNEQGAVWIAWSPGSGGTCTAPVAPYNIYAYMSLDSVLGDRCFFEVDSSGTNGCTWSVSVAALTAGAGLLSPYPSAGDTPIPQVIITALNGAHNNAAGTDIRPEDAKFATQRMFTPCTSTIYREPYNQTVYETPGLGYGSGNVGTSVESSFSTKTFHVLQFNITGTDPISGNTVPAYTVSTVGAQPVMVTVSPAGGTGLGAATDIQGFTLALFLEGVLGRSTDLVGPTSTNPVTVLVREPLSGTYNTMEFSIPNGSQFKTSQDANNCTSAGLVKSNPFDLASANGAVSGAARRRVIGTSEMVATLQAATTDTLGYFFWSAANAANFTSANGKYLTVNGVDPIANSYSVTGGVFPTQAASNLGNVTFANLNSGDYPIWSALRIVSGSPTPAGVTNLISAAQTLTSTQSDFITLANLKVWHSHFNIYGVNVFNEANGAGINTPGDLCPTTGAAAEGGGDAGGTNVTVIANRNFCSDYGSTIGLVNKNN
jgi:hypothetical protein